MALHRFPHRSPAIPQARAESASRASSGSAFWQAPSEPVIDRHGSQAQSQIRPLLNPVIPHPREWPDSVVSGGLCTDHCTDSARTPITAQSQIGLTFPVIRHIIQKSGPGSGSRRRRLNARAPPRAEKTPPALRGLGERSVDGLWSASTRSGRGLWIVSVPGTRACKSEVLPCNGDQGTDQRQH